MQFLADHHLVLPWSLRKHSSKPNPSTFTIFYEQNKMPQIKSMLIPVGRQSKKSPQHSPNIELSKQSFPIISMIKLPFFLTFMVLKWDVKRFIISLTFQDTQNCIEHNTIIKILVSERQNSVWERKSSKSKIGKITEKEVTSCTCTKQSRKEFITNGRDATMVTDKMRHYPVNTGNPKRCVGLNISPETMRAGRQDR